MPRDGSDVYHIPLGTEGLPDTTIESDKYNAFAHDVEQDLNHPRPIIAGGTGSTSADEALAELGAEKSLQNVDNYDSFVFVPGSFYSLGTASNEPVNGHTYAGICYLDTSGNVVVEARDFTDPNHPIYIRVKSGGTWSAWAVEGTARYVQKSGDTMTGPLVLSGDPTVVLGAATKQYVDLRAVTFADAAPPPAAVPDGCLWFETDTGLLYVMYNDGDSRQWVIACPQPDITKFAPALPTRAVLIGTSVTPDHLVGTDFSWVFSGTGNTLNNIANIKVGQWGVLWLIQDSVGGRTITTWGSSYKFPGGVKPILSTAANAVDMVRYVVRSSTAVDCLFSGGMA